MNKNCCYEIDVRSWMAVLHSCGRQNDGAVAEERRGRSGGMVGHQDEETMKGKKYQWMQCIARKSEKMIVTVCLEPCIGPVCRLVRRQRAQR
jgi:hypothetical protein